MAEKLSGMEQLLHNVMRAAGFDADEIKANVAGFANKFTENNEHILKTLGVIDARLQRIEVAMNIAPENGTTDAHVNLPATMSKGN